MAWASTDIIPQSVNTNVTYSVNGGVNVFDDWIVNLSNKNSSNTPFDFTAMSGATCRMDPAPNDRVASSPSLALSATILSASASGCSLKFAAADVKNAVSGRGTRNIQLSITGTDGTTVLYLAQGAANVVVYP